MLPAKCEAVMPTEA